MRRGQLNGHFIPEFFVLFSFSHFPLAGYPVRKHRCRLGLSLYGSPIYLFFHPSRILPLSRVKSRQAFVPHVPLPSLQSRRVALMCFNLVGGFPV